MWASYEYYQKFNHNHSTVFILEPLFGSLSCVPNIKPRGRGTGVVSQKFYMRNSINKKCDVSEEPAGLRNIKHLYQWSIVVYANDIHELYLGTSYALHSSTQNTSAYCTTGMYRFDTKTMGSAGYRNPKALGCSAQMQRGYY